MPGTGGIVLFDGVCNLCNGFVNAVIERDPDGYFTFGALQSDPARAYLDAFGLSGDVLDSVVLIEGGRLYRRSTAALRILRRLSPPWPLAYLLVAIPRPVRDRVYDWIAGRRYRWFGKRSACRVPTPELRSRFLRADRPRPGRTGREGEGGCEAHPAPDGFGASAPPDGDRGGAPERCSCSSSK
jgi:predicted DCC family thiol-disulfide oxidoreductase YuxK